MCVCILNKMMNISQYFQVLGQDQSGFILHVTVKLQ